jgi:hypothetical protein
VSAITTPADPNCMQKAEGSSPDKPFGRFVAGALVRLGNALRRVTRRA